jgi:hypothetical protein
MSLPPQEWSGPNDGAEAIRIAADHQKMSAAISAKNLRVETWEDFEVKFQEIEAEAALQKKSAAAKEANSVWYRGHANSDWKLATTLERGTNSEEIAVEEYFHIMRRVKAEIGTYTEHDWKVPSKLELDILVRDYDAFSIALLAGTLPYDYMTYLRHHGFPSPLLDWTASPYVAAYFAFAKAKETDNVAIYAFIDRIGSIKGGGSDRPNISIVGPNIRTHKRHFLQRSRYTLCTQFFLPSGWKFVSHEGVFKLGDQRQDVLWKIVIPASERTKVLGSLDRFNLNAYSLFGSEDSLMETLAIREIDLKS